MKGVLGLVLLGILTTLIQLTASRSPEFEKFVENAKAKCKKEGGLSDDDDRRNPPIDGKCCPFCACWVNEIGYMTNGQWNLTNAEKINYQKWDDPSKAKLNTEIDRVCFKEVPTAGKRECESALEYWQCKKKLAANLGLVKPK